MAYTERYVRADATGLDNGTTEALAWTFDQAIATNAAGHRVNVKSGAYAYTLGAFTMGPGTVVLPCLYRGYKTTPGDLDAQGRNTDGTLNTTDFPTLSATGGIITPNTFSFFQNFVISASLNSAIFLSGSVDSWGLVNCSVTNSNAVGAGACIAADDLISLINCDFYCTGAAHGNLVDCDDFARVIGCTFRPTVDTAICVTCNHGTFYRNVFIGVGGTGIGVATQVLTGIFSTIFVDNTFYNLGTAIQSPNGAQSGPPFISIDNMVTDCNKYLVSLHAAGQTYIESNLRTRDNATPRTLWVEVTSGKEVTTDTGGPESDYASVTTGDLQLIPSSPARLAGMMPKSDCGAYQSGGSGGISSRPLRSSGRSS